MAPVRRAVATKDEVPRCLPARVCDVIEARRARETVARPVWLRARGDKMLRRANTMKMFATLCNVYTNNKDVLTWASKRRVVYFNVRLNHQFYIAKITTAAPNKLLIGQNENSV